MNSRFFFPLISLATALFSGTVVAPAAPTEPAAPTKAPAVENKTIPKSVFTVPTNHKEGRNPFYPDSNPFVSVAPKQPDITNLVMNGLSTTPNGGLLAMINGKSFANGEAGDVPLGQGVRIKIRCVEVKTNSVIIELIEVGGERKELPLRGK